MPLLPWENCIAIGTLETSPFGNFLAELGINPSGRRLDIRRGRPALSLFIDPHTIPSNLVNARFRSPNVRDDGQANILFSRVVNTMVFSGMLCFSHLEGLGNFIPPAGKPACLKPCSKPNTGNPTQTLHAYYTHPPSGATETIFDPLHYDSNYESHAVAIFQGGLAHPHQANGPIPHLGSLVVTFVPESPALPSQSDSIANAVSPNPMTPTGQSNSMACQNSSPSCFLSPPVGGATTAGPVVPPTVAAIQPEGSDTGAIVGSDAGAIDAPAQAAQIAVTHAFYMENQRRRASETYAGVPPDDVLFAIDRERWFEGRSTGLDVGSPFGQGVYSPGTPGVNSAGDAYELNRDREVYEEYDRAAQAAAANGPASASVVGFGMSVISVGLLGQPQTHSSLFHLVFGLAHCEDVPLPGVLQMVPGGNATAAQVLTIPTIFPCAQLSYPNYLLR